jgi:hypothetical protein
MVFGALDIEGIGGGTVPPVVSMGLAMLGCMLGCRGCIGFAGVEG